MNLPMLAALLEEVPLEKIASASRIKELVNNETSQLDFYIDIKMTGLELTRWFKDLPFTLQDKLFDLDLIPNSERTSLLFQIEMYKELYEGQVEIKRRIYKLTISFVATVTCFIHLVVAGMYYLEAVKNGLHVDSHVVILIDFLFKFISLILGQ